MEYAQEVFVGIDPGAIAGRSKRAFTYVALNADRKLLALASGDLTEVLAFLTNLPQAVVAINGPARLNCGLLNRQPGLPGEVSQKTARMRQVEFQFRSRGLHIPLTPSTMEECPHWLTTCLHLYHDLGQAGYSEISNPGNPRQVLETLSEALFDQWTNGARLLPAGSLEGRLQRQLALFDQRLPVWDAMELFEEITRHKILHGVLPVERLHSHQELNALAAAGLAWQARHHPESLRRHGEPDEGILYT